MLFLVRDKKNDKIHKKGIYLPIGGHVELGESVETAAIREVKEESGVIVYSLDLRGIIYIRGQNTGEYDMIIYTFTSSDFNGEPVPGNEGYFSWVDIADIPRINAYEGDKLYLELMMKYRFFAVDFLYKEYTLVSSKILKVIS